MVDALVSGASAERHAGSIPVLGTKNPVRLMSGGISVIVTWLLKQKECLRCIVQTSYRKIIRNAYSGV